MNNLIMETRLQELSEILDRKVRDFAALDRQRLEGLVTIRNLLQEDLQKTIDATLVDSCSDASVKLRQLRNDERLPDIYKPQLDGIRDELKKMSTAHERLSDVITNASDTLNERIKQLVLVTEGGDSLLKQLAQQATGCFDEEVFRVSADIRAVFRDLKAVMAAKPSEDTPTLYRQMWTAYRDTVLPHSQTLFRDYVDFLRGLALRDAELDDGISRIGDELLKPIQVKDLHHSLTIPVHQEALSKTVARIIRLSFPEWTIWGLPLVAHEFAYILAAGSDFKDLIAEERENRPTEKRHIDDYFADIFASCSMGTAYACAAVMLRLDPLDTEPRAVLRPESQSDQPADADLARDNETPRESRSDHPSDLRRAHVMFRTLHWAQRERSEIQGFTRIIEDHWNDVLTRCGRNPQQSEEEGSDIQSLIEVFGPKLYSAIPGVRYPTSPQCSAIVGLKKEMLNDNFDPESISGTGDLRDVLNAAWWARLELWRQMVDEGRSEDERRNRIDTLGAQTRQAIDKLLNIRKPGKGKAYGQHS